MKKKYTNKLLKKLLLSIEAKSSISLDEYLAYKHAKLLLLSNKKGRNPFYVPTMYELNGDIRSLEVLTKVSKEKTDK